MRQDTDGRDGLRRAAGAPPARWRYLASGGVLLLAILVAAVGNELVAGVGLYAVGAASWAIGACLERGSLARRLLLIWAPAVPLILWMAATYNAMQADDAAGIAVALLFVPTALVCTVCLFASALAFLGDLTPGPRR
jgi:hypothetical protein